jgi:hypothetical protein
LLTKISNAVKIFSMGSWVKHLSASAGRQAGMTDAAPNASHLFMQTVTMTTPITGPGAWMA